MTATNRHIVDQLADVRAEQKALKAREDALKAEVMQKMGSRNSLGGDEFIASQSITSRRGDLDEDALRRAGIDLDRYRKPASSYITVRVERRISEAA